MKKNGINWENVRGRMRELRGEENQISFAKKIGITQSKLSQYETGITKELPYDTLQQYVEYCQTQPNWRYITADWLLFGSQPAQVSEPSELDRKYRDAPDHIKVGIASMLRFEVAESQPNQAGMVRDPAAEYKNNRAEQQQTPIPIYEQITADAEPFELLAAWCACVLQIDKEIFPKTRDKLYAREEIIKQWLENKTEKKFSDITLGEIGKTMTE